MPLHDRKYRSRFRNTEEKDEEERFSLDQRGRPPMDLSRRILIWAPVVLAAIIGWYFVHTYLING